MPRVLKFALAVVLAVLAWFVVGRAMAAREQ
jgi:hypothetical protein